MLFPRRRDGADTGAADTGLGPAALIADAAADVEDVSGLLVSAGLPNEKPPMDDVLLLGGLPKRPPLSAGLLAAELSVVVLPPKREPVGLTSSFLSSGFDSEGLAPNEKPVDFGTSDCVLFVAVTGWVPNEKPVDLDEPV